MPDNSSKEKEAIVGVVEIIENVLLPNLMDRQRGGQFRLLPVIHHRLELHELTIAFQSTNSKALAPSVDAHAPFDQWSGSSSQRRIVLSVHFPPLLDLVFFRADYSREP